MLDNFKSIIRADIEEFIATQKMEKARELKHATGHHFNHNEYPMYFTGKLDAELVLVHLNPKQQKNDAETYTGHLRWPTFEDYFSYHQYYGRHTYGPQTSRSWKSLFDQKQIRFIQPFGVIDFVEERTREDRFTNLEKVIDDKLQLELIPYGSDTFSTKGFTPEILQPHIDRVLEVIGAYPRKYVLFCGRIFEKIFRQHIVDRYEVKLVKNDGTAMKNTAKFSNLRFDYRGQVLHAGLAYTFAMMGIPMSAYGRMCRERYRC
jgi:hypothetical protein